MFYTSLSTQTQSVCSYRLPLSLSLTPPNAYCFDIPSHCVGGKVYFPSISKSNAEKDINIINYQIDLLHVAIRKQAFMTVDIFLTIAYTVEYTETQYRGISRVNFFNVFE